MTTEKMRLVTVNLQSSRQLVFQLDTGVPALTRKTFYLDLPSWVQLMWPLGFAFGVSDQPSLVEGVGGGLAASSVTVYTFRPGAAADLPNRIYDTWVALKAAHDADTGQRAIAFDNSSAAITIPTGAQAFDNRTRLIPAAGITASIPITLSAGTALNNPAFVSPQLNFSA